ncbi:3-oxo-5a-steroid 4- dehydrogenase [Pleurotus pulmonarius]|nr:3-oxo-5a-steroid 4- dehydrogenase [Pleurotus pulmonarius]KAF4579839.1 3-oxo-5a-steroid 4- dehydrogenase [Pleurotus pulmonarius]
MTLTVTISSASKSALRQPVVLEFPGKSASEVTIRDVKAALASKVKKLYVERQKLSQQGDKKALDDGLKLTEVGFDARTEECQLSVKDLGPQIQWRTVFIVEYLGPILIHPLIYYLPSVFYGSEVQHSKVQSYVFAFVVLHFLKRELETLFVHRFSHATMPAKNIFKNSAHYHIFSGLLLAYDIYRPKYASASNFIVNTHRDNPQFLNACAAVWLFAELSNLSTHLTLRSLRPAGTGKRGIPYGYGFGLVSCPNYFFETVGWFVICIMTNSIAAWLFFAISTGQMAIWAVKKHRNYKKEFGKDYPRGRKAMIPFIF